ncbi:hypothetical protein EDD16DRAFT_1699753 [Pisolithus croceorrhizus]|nr:hypothetical protein F5141DRAFT_1293222 [Pisolithus sp. B1]KAI6132611.1 hypothetical protein EDD16DRAFT_1699753 [Pisolithus croceorrhizus]KAI6141366.1 hypothetical protein EDD17DRAFT_1769804 [Pisolithus thermaeus]
MPTLSTSMQSSMQYVAEHGIGAVLVFEYLYFLLQARNAQRGLQEYLNLAIQTYQSSGIHDQVNKLIQEAFQKYGEDVETLSPVFVGIAEENKLSKMLNKNAW